MARDCQQTHSLDDVLFAFHQACLRPTAEEIIDWTTRYPQFADDIRAHAGVARDWAARKTEPVCIPDVSPTGNSPLSRIPVQPAKHMTVDDHARMREHERGTMPLGNGGLHHVRKPGAE